MGQFDYDLIVIGGGIAGMVSAVTANGLGKKVAVVEKSRIGGNCTNTTCIPSKALITLSHISRDIKYLKELNIISDREYNLDTTKIMPHIRGIINKAYEKDRPETFSKIGIDIFEGSGKFIDANHIEIGDKTLSASRFIIASGTTPFIPAIEGLKDIDFLTNETLYKIDDLPESLIILGGGVDGLEYASAFGLLGVKTTVVEMATRLLPMVDLELVNHLIHALRKQGISILTGARATRFSKRDNKVVLVVEHAKEGRQEEVIADKVIVAVGRKPDLEGLCLEKAGAKYNPKGIVVDNKLRTTAPNIYACGDIVGPYQLASTAEAQAIIAATNAFLPVGKGVDYNNNVYVIFTDPPIAYLGLTEEQAYKKFGDRLMVYRFDYKNMRRAIIDGKNYGMAKILCDKRGYIVGAHVLGESAPEVIHEIQVIRAMDTPLRSLNMITHAYPTYSQALVGRAGQLAFLDYMGNNIFVKTALKILPGFKNRLLLARDRLAESGPSKPFVRTIRYEDAFRPYQKVDKKTQIEVGPSHDLTCIIETKDEVKSIKVHITGDLNRFCEKTLYFICMDAIGQSKNITLDLSGLSHIDMDGAGIIIKCASVLSKRGLTIEITGLRDNLIDLFRLTGIDKVVTFVDRQGYSQGNSTYKGDPVTGWARSIDILSVKGIPEYAMNINVNGRKVTGPTKGFGQFWEKIYRLRLVDNNHSPEQIISIWRTKFPEFWPKGNTAITSEGAPITPGTTAVLNLSIPGGLTLATGIFVAYADNNSFGFLTIEGHMLSGWITFSSFYEDDSVIIQVHPLFRASDPLMEISLRLGGARQEDLFWHRTLKNIARSLGSHGTIEQYNNLIDDRLKWDEKANIWKNSVIRSFIYMPVYLIKKITLSKIHKKSIVTCL